MVMYFNVANQTKANSVKFDQYGNLHFTSDHKKVTQE